MARVKIYTRGGDDGSTALGDGRRVSKACPRVEAYGAVDELNSLIGVVLAGGSAADVEAALKRIQAELFCVGAAVCNPKSTDADYRGPRVGVEHVTALEADIDRLEANLEPLKNFILPGGHPVAAQLHTARTVCRRAERLAILLAETEAVDPHVVPYLNRLSDLLFVMARFQNKHTGVDEPIWQGKKQKNKPIED